MTKKKRPPKCCKTDCFHCPYTDCQYEGMDAEDFLGDMDENDIPREIQMRRARANRYAKKNREKIRQYSLKHYYEHREEYNERSRKWQRENKERVAAMKRKRWADNPEYYRQKQREYRARKKVEKIEREKQKTVGSHKGIC